MTSRQVFNKLEVADLRERDQDRESDADPARPDGPKRPGRCPSAMPAAPSAAFGSELAAGVSGSGNPAANPVMLRLPDAAADRDPGTTRTKVGVVSLSGRASRLDRSSPQSSLIVYTQDGTEAPASRQGRRPMNLGTWFRNCTREYQNDPTRRRLIDSFEEAFHVREDDPGDALHRYREGKDLANRLGEKWWSLLFDKMQLDAKIHFQRDFRDLPEPAEACVREVGHSVYDNFPGTLAVHDTLVSAYLGIDAEGFHQNIHEQLEALEHNMPDGATSDRYCLLARQREFAIEEFRWDDAYTVCSASSNRPFRSARGAGVHFAVRLRLAVSGRVRARRGPFDDRDRGSRSPGRGTLCELEILAWRPSSGSGRSGRHRTRARDEAARHRCRASMVTRSPHH